MRVCVIGFGAAGLAAARHVSIEHECLVFEQTDKIGGTWVYTEETGKNEYDLPIHTSMYRGLRTNLPKEIMGYPDFPIPEQNKSYLPSDEILQFLNKYAEHFNLIKYVKFNHLVKKVVPFNGSWKVTVEDLPNKQEKIYTFDAVMVCNGHYSTPMYPNIPGMQEFSEQLHSHDYRHPECFKGKIVVIVGAGPSGIDIALDVASTAKQVILSRHRCGDKVKNVFPENVKMKYEIREIQGNNIIFDDEEIINADILFYCTVVFEINLKVLNNIIDIKKFNGHYKIKDGRILKLDFAGYKYNFPFFTKECGIVVEDNCVQPLYKHLIHIEHPTLCLVGLPYYVCAFSLFDLQVRFFLKAINGGFQLPSKEEMYADTKKEMERRRKHGLKRKQFHMMGSMQGDYYSELAKAGGLDPLLPVMAELHNFASQRQLNDLKSFREDAYRVIDSKTFIKVK